MYTYLLHSLLPISIPPSLDVLCLPLYLVGVEVPLLDQPVGELHDGVDLVVVGLHRGEERLVLLDEVLGLLEVRGWLGLGESEGEIVGCSVISIDANMLLTNFCVSNVMTQLIR